MTIKDLIQLYESKKAQYGENAYKYISNILAEAKEQHKIDFLKSDVAQKEGREPK